jgi:polyadenylate-binding protein
MQFDELSGLSPVVRQEVLTGELIRRLRSFPEVKPEEIDAIVEHLMGQNLDTICAGLASSQVLLTQIKAAKENLGLVQPAPEVGPSRTELYSTPATISRTASINSTLLDPNTLAATASAPEHPSTPVSFTPSMNTPPRTASPTGSIALGTEKERLVAVVAALEPSRAADITEMLLSLSKKERAMCLFSNEYLRVKVETAKGILETLAEEDESAPVAEMRNLSVTAPPQAPAPTTPQAQYRRPEAITSTTPQTPELSSSNGPSTTTSPADPPTPAGVSVHTLATLAKLPALEIVKLASSPQSTGLPLPKADPLVVKSTDEFVDGLLVKPLAAQKQLLGEKL